VFGWIGVAGFLTWAGVGPLLLGCMGLGRVYKRSVVRGLRLRAGSRRLGFMLNTKKAKRMSFDPVCGSNDNPAGLDFEILGFGSLVPKALDSLIATPLAIKSGSSSMGVSPLQDCQKVVVLASPMDTPVFFAQAVLVRQDGLRPEVATTVGMGSGLSVDANEFSFHPKGAGPCLCTAMVDDLSASEYVANSILLPAVASVSYDSPPVEVSAPFGF
jgi:hypothetical protein